MKGLERVILYVFLMIIGLILLFAVLRSLFNYNPQNTDVTINQPTTDLNDHFDYTTYLLSTSPIDLSTYNECDKLKNAIKYAILTGKPYKVDEISYGNDLASPVSLPLIGDCLEEDIEIPIGSGINQTVCRFKPISNNLNVGVTDYGGISDATSLDFDNCAYIYNQYYSLPQYSIGPEVEEVNLNPGTINLYYSSDHFYIKNGDYSHYQSINNITAFDNAYNGPGRLKIYVGNATSINGECKFNIYLCPRPAIAKSKSDSPINIFKIFRDLEVYDLPSLPYYIRDLSDLASPMSSYSKEVYYWNSYDIKLDKNYRVETIINAIKSGLYLDVRLNNYFDHPHWDILEDSRISSYTISNMIGINIGIKQGSGSICAKAAGRTDQCTSTSMVAKFNPGESVTFEAYGDDFLMFEGSGGNSFSNFTVNVNNNGYVVVLFNGPSTGDISINIGVKEGEGTICAKTPSKSDQCTTSGMIARFNNGNVVIFEATPNPNNVFIQFVGTAGVSNQKSFTTTVDSDGFVDAVFSNDRNGECWIPDYDNLIKSSSTNDRTRSIRFNCGDDNICSGDLRVKVALRKDSRTDIDVDRDGKEDNLNYISGVISFCDT